MLDIKEGIDLYHSSYIEVKNIDLSLCLPGKDFGKGFYLTSSLNQAKNFIKITVNRAISRNLISATTNFGYISTFKIKSIKDLNIKIFDSANIEWLHFIAGNRDNNLFPELFDEYKKYDIIIGKIANDRTAATLQLYIAGAFGEPGSEPADRIAIETLLPNRLENQFCFKTKKAISILEFIKSEKFGF